MITVTIERSKWYRGKGSNSSLLHGEGSGEKLCCLGFLGRACKISDHNLRCPNPTTSVRIGADRFSWPAAIRPPVGLREESPLSSELMKINDELHYDELERERRIAELGATGNIDFVFVD